MTTLHVLMDRSHGQKKDRGATAVEYAFLAGFVALAIVATLVLLGPKLDAFFVKALNGLP
ncbi:Flp family type IVb pilin [Streptomyces griseoincarnatus]|uniref:Flp family type IVb pilin n=1 Tax=Promicromonospora sp. NPDC057138 TaxID=3346031 RepID=UPI00363D40BE